LEDTTVLLLMLMAAIFQGSAQQPAHRPPAVAASANAPEKNPGRADARTPETAIRAVLGKQVEDWNRGDVTAFMQGYWKSSETEFVSADGILRGWQPVLDRYRKTYPNAAAMGHLTFSGLEIKRLGPKAALAVGQWHLKRASGGAGGVFTLVFRKFPQGWLIINDHTSRGP
jgi:ketosteroid isomerase-like protein